MANQLRLSSSYTVHLVKYFRLGSIELKAIDRREWTDDWMEAISFATSTASNSAYTLRQRESRKPQREYSSPHGTKCLTPGTWSEKSLSFPLECECEQPAVIPNAGYSPFFHSSICRRRCLESDETMTMSWNLRINRVEYVYRTANQQAFLAWI